MNKSIFDSNIDSIINLSAIRIYFFLSAPWRSSIQPGCTDLKLNIKIFPVDLLKEEIELCLKE